MKKRNQQANNMKSLKMIIVFLLLTGNLFSQLTVNSLSCEHKKNPIGIDISNPRLSWKLGSSGSGILQTAWQVRVATDNRFSSSRIVWSSGKITSDESVLLPYQGTQLKPGVRYYWQVKVWDNKGNESKWSETAFWETGLMNQSGWKAGWIEMKGDTNRYAPSPYFRKEFTVTKKVAAARVYVTSHGFYELHLNGRKVGDQVLTPGWTSYGKRLQYQVYDVTDLIVNGTNAAGAVLGDGWYRGTLAWGNNWAIYGKHLGLLMQLKLTYTDGTEDIIITDESWKANNDGAIRMNDIYNGETYDATKSFSGWDKPGFNDSNWQKVVTGKYNNNIIASEGSPVKTLEELKPLKIFRTPKGSLVADMGQNMVGWIRLKVKGPRGTVVTVRHAEVLDKYGEFYTTNYRSARCQLTYTLAGNGTEVYELSLIHI